MPRWAARADANQADVVEELEAHGYAVIHTYRAGGDAPDFIVAHPAWPLINLLVELKNPKRPKSADGRHRQRQADCRKRWPGLYIQAMTAQDIMGEFQRLGRPLV